MRKDSTERITELQKSLLRLQALYLHVLRREVANICIDRDLDRFVRAFNKMEYWENDIAEAAPERQKAEYAQLLSKYETFESWDVICVRHFVPYESAWISTEELFDLYADLSRFLILDALFDKRVRRKIFSEHEINSFQETINNIKDRRLRRNLEEAMRRYDRSKESCFSRYEDPEFEIEFLRDGSPELVHLVHCTASGEYGVRTIFTFDDGHSSVNYCRTDASGGRRVHLKADAGYGKTAGSTT